MDYWVITDTHFGHKKLQEYSGRPEDFEERILENVRRTVRPVDVLIHLGDFCIYKDEEWHKRFMDACAGRRWLIRGNHDKKSLSWYLSHGWHSVVDELVLDVYGKRIAFSHKPLTEGVFDLNIHGHLHNTGHHPEDETTDRNRLVVIEHGYKPISLRSIVEP